MPAMHSASRDDGQTGVRPEFDQFFTPEWAADVIMRRYFGDLCADDMVVDPGTGRGAFLKAVPAHVPAIGVEIDPALAAFASEDSGRKVLVGDFRAVPLPGVPSVVIGNPPFSREIAEGFLRRAAEMLPENGRCGFILPSSFLSFSSTLMRWHEIFSIRHDSLPRDIFPRIRVPLSFFLFSRERVKHLHGFFLFEEAAAIRSAPKNVKLVLIQGKRKTGVWKAAVQEALQALGGRAQLKDLYEHLEGRLPARIQFWQETVRRVLQEGGFRNISRGEWALATQ